METNVKMVGFANRSINGVTITNEGFDMEYDGKKLDISGFSGDKLYYAKLNNQQLADLLNMPSSDVPLERRISLYGNHKKGSVKRIKISTRKPKSVKSKKSSQLRVSKRKSNSVYVSPKLRSEYRRSSRHSSRHSSKKSKSSKKTKRSIAKTIY